MDGDRDNNSSVVLVSFVNCYVRGYVIRLFALSCE